MINDRILPDGLYRGELHDNVLRIVMDGRTFRTELKRRAATGGYSVPVTFVVQNRLVKEDSITAADSSQPFRWLKPEEIEP